MLDAEVLVDAFDRGSRATVALRGALSLSSAVQVRRVLEKTLLDRGSVLVDISALDVLAPASLAVFPAVLAATGGWPSARLVLVGPRPAVEEMLRRAQLNLSAPVAGTWAEAEALLAVRPDRVTRRTEIPAERVAGVLSRAVVHDACEEWGVTDLSYAAAMVVTELVTNAVEHARTSSTLTVALSPCGLHLSVRDRATASLDDLEAFGDPRGAGQGLLLVRGLSTSWGVARHADGKTVWAVLPGGENTARTR